MRDKKMYEIELGDGSELASSEYKVYSEIQNLGNTLNPEELKLNNLPLKFDKFTDLNNLFKEKYMLSIKGGCMSINIIPENSLGGNLSLCQKPWVKDPWHVTHAILLMVFDHCQNSTSYYYVPNHSSKTSGILKFKKCLSNVNNNLSSDLAILAMFLSSEPNGTILTSKPSLTSSSASSFGMFSSQRSLGLLLEGNIFLFFDDSRSIVQSRENCISCELREVIIKNFFLCDSCSKQFDYLPDHNSGAFESKLSITNFTICNNMGINFYSHEINNNKEIFKPFDIKSEFILQPVIDVYEQVKKEKVIKFLDKIYNKIKLIRK